MKYAGANSLTDDMDILPKLPELNLAMEEDNMVAANDGLADVGANATPDTKSVEMLSSSSVSTEGSSVDSLQSASSATSNQGEEDCCIDGDDDLLDLLVDTLDVDIDLELL